MHYKINSKVEQFNKMLSKRYQHNNQPSKNHHLSEFALSISEEGHQKTGCYVG